MIEAASAAAGSGVWLYGFLCGVFFGCVYAGWITLKFRRVKARLDLFTGAVPFPRDREGRSGTRDAHRLAQYQKQLLRLENTGRGESKEANENRVRIARIANRLMGGEEAAV